MLQNNVNSRANVFLNFWTLGNPPPLWRTRKVIFCGVNKDLALQKLLSSNFHWGSHQVDKSKLAASNALYVHRILVDLDCISTLQHADSHAYDCTSNGLWKNLRYFFVSTNRFSAIAWNVIWKEHGVYPGAKSRALTQTALTWTLLTRNGRTH